MGLKFERMSLEESKDSVRELLGQLTRQIDFAIYAIVEGHGVLNQKALTEQSDVIKTVFLMIQGVGVSIHSIIKLTSSIDMGIRDCFGIARSVSEGALNATYIIAGGSEVAAKARRHALQKSYRDLHRETQVGDIKVNVSRDRVPQKSSILGLEEALYEFTRKNGKEISEWSGISLDEKVAFIIKKYPLTNISASMLTFSIYRHASEILHGSYFGVQYFWTGGGTSDPTKNGFESSYVYNHLVQVFTAVYSAVSLLIEVIYMEYDIPELEKEHKSFAVRAADLFGEESKNA